MSYEMILYAKLFLKIKFSYQKGQVLASSLQVKIWIWTCYISISSLNE